MIKPNNLEEAFNLVSKTWSPFSKLWKMNLSCALRFSSSFICSQYFNESNEADIAKGYLPSSLLQARFDEYLFTPIRNLKNLVWILSGKKSSYDSSRLWLFTFDAIFTKFRLYGLQISEQYNNIGLIHASNSLHWSVGKWMIIEIFSDPKEYFKSFIAYFWYSCGENARSLNYYPQILEFLDYF